MQTIKLKDQDQDKDQEQDQDKDQDQDHQSPTNGFFLDLVSFKAVWWKATLPDSSHSVASDF